jgi:hypothetical protein
MQDLLIGAGIGVEFEIGYYLGASQHFGHGGPDGYARVWGKLSLDGLPVVRQKLSDP